MAWERTGGSAHPLFQRMLVLPSSVVGHRAAQSERLCSASGDCPADQLVCEKHSKGKLREAVTGLTSSAAFPAQNSSD